MERAKKADDAWDFLWNKYGLIHMVYDYTKDTVINPFYQLNPEAIESAYYLWHYTGDSLYYNRVKKYYTDTKKYCRTEVAYSHVENVLTMKKKDEMETFFIAENMKYFYLTFSKNPPVSPEEYVFNTEAHPFKKSNFKATEVNKRLGFK